ncbi:uncharacterized protein LOC144129470 [Amblyomma americanum]
MSTRHLKARHSTISGTTYEERDFSCPNADIDEPSISSTSVCDGIIDCGTPTGSDKDLSLDDESKELCAPQPYLEKNIVLEVRNVTVTTAHLSWSEVARHAAGDSLALAGYFVTGKSTGHSFQNSISGRLLSYQVQWMKPWTNYTVLVRPFYTEYGKAERIYKLGKAAWVLFRTNYSVPDIPSLVSVLSSQQYNVVLNVIGPSAWNSDPFGFHVRWEATSGRRRPQGELEVALTSEWSMEENTVNFTLPLQGGRDYRVFVSSVGADGRKQMCRSAFLLIHTKCRPTVSALLRP